MGAEVLFTMLSMSVYHRQCYLSCIPDCKSEERCRVDKLHGEYGRC